MICIFRNFCIVKVETVADKDGVKCRVNGTSDERIKCSWRNNGSCLHQCTQSSSRVKDVAM